MFKIYLTDEIVPESEGKAVYGKIHINDYVESFVASLAEWSMADYERQWHLGCERIVAGEEKSALIVSCVSPPVSEYLVWWPLYRDGEIVHVRNELMFYGQTKSPFSLQDPWRAIRDRKMTTDEGLEISEWDTNVASIREFLDESRRTSRH